MSKRWVEILNYLNTREFVTSQTMADVFHISAKTVHNTIKDLRHEVQKHGALIQAKQGSGYALIVKDEKKFQDFIAKINRERIRQPVEAEDRVTNILEILLINAGQYIKIDDLADRFYISKSSISADLKEVRKKLENFHLHLTSKPNYGFKVEGKEFDLRRCTASYVIKRLVDSQDEEIHQILWNISQCVTTQLKESGVHISDICHRNLLIHIYIAVMRIQGGHIVFMEEDLLKAIEKSEEYLLISQIAKSLEKVFPISIPESEIGYLTIHLSGKQFVDNSEAQDNFVVNAQINSIVKMMLDEVKSSYSIDFSQDLELTMNLALHLVPMEIRMQYDLNLQNPLLGDIKKKYPLAYALALSACGILKKTYQKEIEEDEIGYIALYFNLALERKKYTHTKKNIVIVCAAGRGSTLLLKYKFQNEFGPYLNRIETCDVFNLEQFDFSLIDYVVTTVPIPFKIDRPILEVQFFLEDKDIRILKKMFLGESEFTLRQYFDPQLLIPHMTAANKEDVIRQMVDKIKEVKMIPEDFYDLVMERERMAITAFGSRIAIPHPCHPVTEESFVCIAILEQPILWDSVEVQFVFMGVLSRNHENLEAFSTMTSRFLLNAGYIDAMIESRTYETLAECFHEIEKEIKGEGED